MIGVLTDISPFREHSRDLPPYLYRRNEPTTIVVVEEAEECVANSEPLSRLLIKN
jgi:hypothetical protein